MDLTPENKLYIDQLTHYALLQHIRFAPVGDPWMQGETGEYWIRRRRELQVKYPEEAVADSKRLAGW